MWVTIALWSSLAVIVIAAIALANKRDDRVEAAYSYEPPTADEPELRWKATLVTKYKRGELGDDYICRIKLVDSTGQFKPLHGTAYGKNVPEAQTNAMNQLQDIIAKAFDRAEAPATMTVRL